MPDRTSTEAKTAAAQARRDAGYAVDTQWTEGIGTWYLIRQAGTDQPLEIIYEVDGQAYAAGIDQQDPTVTPYAFVQGLLDKTTGEGQPLH